MIGSFSGQYAKNLNSNFCILPKKAKTNDFYQKKAQRLKAVADIQHCKLKFIFDGNLFCGKSFFKKFF